MTSNAPMRILAIGAHPDDIEFGCAGTLARCVQRGDSVVMAVACVGDSASSDLSPEELAKVRSAELKNSARTLGAELIEMGLLDYGVWPNRETAMLFTDVVRQARPDVVITHGNTDYGSDHNNTHIPNTFLNTTPNAHMYLQHPNLSLVSPFSTRVQKVTSLEESPLQSVMQPACSSAPHLFFQ